MAAPTYVAKKVGDQYVVVPKNPATTPQGTAWLLGGGVLAGLGLIRRGVSGAAMALLGGAMIYRGLTGCSLIKVGLPAASDDSEERGPSFQHDSISSKQTSKQTAQDEIDEAAMESFPASDPPAKTVTAVI